MTSSVTLVSVLERIAAARTSWARFGLFISSGSLAVLLVLEYRFEQCETKKANPSHVDDHCKR